MLKVWSDKQILAGTNWKDEIEKALASTKVAILLVTPAFLASDFIASDELPPLLEAAKNEGLIIFWIAVSDSNYRQTVIAQYQAANDPKRPLDKLSVAERNTVLVKISEEILNAMNP